MRLLTLILLKLIFSLYERLKHLGDHPDSPAAIMVQEIRDTVPKDWERWFNQREINWVKGYCGSPHSPSVLRSEASPPPSYPARDAPEVSEEEEEVEPEEEPAC